MNILWVAQDNKKDGSFRQYKAEVLSTIASLLTIKHFSPNFKTHFYLDKWTEKFYGDLGVLDLFDNVNTKVLDSSSEINFEMFYAAPKIVALNDLTGPVLNIDLDFFLYSDLQKLNFFDSDISTFYLEINEPYAYLTPDRGMSLTSLKWDLPFDNDAYNVSIFYIKNSFYRNYYCSEMIKYMTEVSKKHYHSFPKNEYFQLMLFIDQYISHQFAKKHNQTLKIFIEDFYPIEERHHYVTSTGIKLLQSGNYCYHFGNHKQYLTDKSFNNQKCDWIYQKTIETIGYSEPLEKLYGIPLDDYRFKS